MGKAASGNRKSLRRKGLLAFYRLRGAGKEVFRALGGGEGFLLKERAEFQTAYDQKFRTASDKKQ